MSGDDFRIRFRSGYSPRPPMVRQGPNTVDLPLVPGAQSVAGKSRVSRKIFLLCIVFILLLGSVLSGWYFIFNDKNPTPASVNGLTSSPVYYPEKLPAGFVLDNKSYSVSSDIVSYSAVNEKNQRIIFTIQPRPPTFDYQSFYQKGLSDTEQFLTPNGEAAIGRTQNRLMGSLVANDTWVILSLDTDEVSASELKFVLNNLKLAE